MRLLPVPPSRRQSRRWPVSDSTIEYLATAVVWVALFVLMAYLAKERK